MKKQKRVEILTIGDELLDGRVVDTNSVRLAQAFSEVGLHIQQRVAITDDKAIIVREAKASAARGTDLCIVSGGLGPTSDDVTAEAFAELLGVPLMRDPQQAEHIRQRLVARGRTVTENQFRQADRPQGADLLLNPRGTAPGFALDYQGCRFISAPGVPHEFDAMIHAAVIEPMRADSVPVARRRLYVFGIIEAEIDHKLAPIHTRWPNVRLQFRVKLPEIHVTLHAPEEALADLDAACAFAHSQLGAHVFTTEDQALPAALLQTLRAHKATLALAESCTGGLMSDLLTDTPGSSDVVQLSLVAYDNRAKTQILKVSEETLAQHGAVSQACVLEMARGAQQLINATYGLAVSGIAGPGGATEIKPVGTIWIGIAGPDGASAHKLQLHHDRRGNKLWSAYHAMDMLRHKLLAST